MKLFLKILLALILILTIAVVGFAVVFNPNDYKDDIITLVKEKTGRTLSIPGDISLSLFPWIGIDLGEIEISNAQGFGKQPFAKMEHLQVRAKLWPLFKQQLEADTIVIEGLKLNLAKNSQGITN
ncbi:MAG: AsmA family protein, partial [Gammaproteobacteria bacterium]|nr:AsmA family protein [Gammaproteobacteria bacterium]